MLLPPMGKGRFYDLIHKFGVSFCIGVSLLALIDLGIRRTFKAVGVTENNAESNKEDNLEIADNSKENLPSL